MRGVEGLVGLGRLAERIVVEVEVGQSFPLGLLWLLGLELWLELKSK